MTSASAERTDGTPGVGLLGSPVRRQVVDELAALDREARPVGLTAAELGERLGLHTTTIRFHVDQLVAAGILGAHFVRSGGVGRPSKKYVLREESLGDSARAAGTKPFEVLAGLLASTLAEDESERLTPEEAGEAWALRRAEAVREERGGDGGDGAVDGVAGGGRDAKVDQVIALLGEWGYTPDPEPLEDGTAVDVNLRACPFLDLARSHPDVVCGVHRGLLRGALTAVGEADARVSLEPFVGPDLCRARLYLPDDQRRASP